MPKTASRNPLRLDAILDEARAIVRGHGIDGLSLRRLARNLGVTAPALYAHIHSKNELVRALAEVEFEALVDRMLAIRVADPARRLGEYSRAYITHALAEPELFDLMFLFAPDVGATDLPVGVELPAATRAFAIPLAAVEEAIAAGAIADADPLVIALTLWTSAHGVAASIRLGLGLPAAVEAALIDESVERMIRGWRP